MTTTFGKKVISAIGALALLGMATVSFAEGPMQDDNGSMQKHRDFHHERKGGEYQHGRMAKALGLTEEQKQMLTTRREAKNEDMRAQHQQLRKLRQDMRAAVEANASAAELEQLATQLGELTKQQALARAQEQQYFLSVLTSEQKNKLAELKTERQKKWHKGERKCDANDESAI